MNLLRNRVEKGPARLQVIERVIGWTRERFGLSSGAEIHAWEIACAVPGCPPVETVVTFWDSERRHHFKVFKPLEQVVRDDLPPAWFRDALAVPEGFECDCC